MTTASKAHEVSETAALYACGSLPEGEARRFEQRLKSGCPYCIAEFGECQKAVEGLLWMSPSASPAPGLEAKLFERIGRPPESTAATETRITRSQEGTWMGVSAGVLCKLLHGKRTMLVKMDPGAKYPVHTHHFDEQCIVLEGEIQDSDGNTVRPGDFVFMAKGTIHQPIFSETGALFLIAYT